MAEEVEQRIKAAAVAEVILGEPIRKVARKYGVSHVSVQKWRDQAASPPVVVPEKRLELGNLIAVFLREGLDTLVAHARFARNEDWLAKQTAESLAVYDGVLYDKMAHVLGSLRDVAPGTDGDAIAVGPG